MEVTNNRELITLYNDAIGRIYHEQNLIPLRGESYKYDEATYLLPNGKQLLEWSFNILNGVTTNDNIHEMINDILFLSDEIIFFTAHLYLYRPFINNPLTDAIDDSSSSTTYFPEQVNIERRRYDMYVDILFEKVYSYWNRIGNIIALFFPDIFSKKGKVYFYLITELKSLHSENEDFMWLLHFKENQYKRMNTVYRKDIVHNITTHIKGINKQLVNCTDPKKTEEIVKKRFDYADYFKELNQLCIEGFEKTLCFLESVK